MGYKYISQTGKTLALVLWIKMNKLNLKDRATSVVSPVMFWLVGGGFILI